MTSRSSLSSLHDGGKPYHYLAFPATGLPVFLLTVNQLKEFGSLNNTTQKKQSKQKFNAYDIVGFNGPLDTSEVILEMITRDNYDSFAPTPTHIQHNAFMKTRTLQVL